MSVAVLAELRAIGSGAGLAAGEGGGKQTACFVLEWCEDSEMEM